MPNPPVKVRIRGYQFEISAPYSIGDAMGEVEVLHLNDLRADNIRNNISKLVLDEIAVLPPGQMLSPRVLEELQERIGKYDAKYKLQLKHNARERVGLLDAEARMIAEERLDTQLRQLGQTPSPEDYAKMLDEFISLPQVQELARQRVLVKAEVAKRELGDLL